MSSQGGVECCYRSPVVFMGARSVCEFSSFGRAGHGRGVTSCGETSWGKRSERCAPGLMFHALACRVYLGDGRAGAASALCHLAWNRACSRCSRCVSGIRAGACGSAATTTSAHVLRGLAGVLPHRVGGDSPILVSFRVRCSSAAMAHHQPGRLPLPSRSHRRNKQPPRTPAWQPLPIVLVSACAHGNPGFSPTPAA